MSILGVSIFQGKVGANVSGREYRTSGLITTGEAVPGKLEHGKVYKLTDVSAFRELELEYDPAVSDEDYDSLNGIIVAEHIREFFRMSGGGATLYFMLAPRNVMLGDLLDNPIYARKMIIEANGSIHNLAVGFNPLDTYVPTYVDGLDSNVRASIAKAQALYNWADQTYRPVEIFLECPFFKGPDSSTLQLRQIPLLSGGILQAENVSVVIGQDFSYAHQFDGMLASKYAAIGTALGTEAACAINENIGEVGTRNLTNELSPMRKQWIEAGLSNHIRIEDQEASLGVLDKAGYIFPIKYYGVSGYRWNDNHTCTPVVRDAEGNINPHNRAYGRTLDLCKRGLRTALLPSVKAVKPVDAKTGKLPTGVIKDFEGIGMKVFEDYISKGWISGGKVVVDPKSDLIIEKLLKVSFTVVPYGNIGSIEGTINLKVSF